MKYIYKITNKLTERVYVGQTKNFENRIKQHIRDSRRVDDIRGNTPLYEDARLIGWDNFSCEILEVCEEIKGNEMEAYWIKFYFNNSYNKSLFPITAFDPEYQKKCVPFLKEATDKMKKKVQQFDIEGNLLKEFDGVREAGRYTGICHHTIQKVAKGHKNRKTAGGFVWKYSD